MSVTIAELNSRIILGLGLGFALPDYCSLPEIHNAVVQRLNVRTAWTELGTPNTVNSLSAEFTPTATQYDITSLIGKGTPLWVEMKVDDKWQPVRVVNLTELHDYYAQSAFACAFYAQDSETQGSDLTQYIEFSFIPASACRIHFRRDQMRIAMTDKSALPDEVAELIVLEAEQTLIPRIKMKIAMNMNRNEKTKNDLQPLFNALDGIYIQNAMDIAPLLRLWTVLSFGEKAQAKSFNKITPRSGGLYG